jgi:hypothetical protein
MVDPLKNAFPKLATGGYAITSPADKRYNCIAYAAGDSANWWWPLPADVQEVFWPAGVSRTETIAAFRDAFASLGFLESDNENLEPGFEKIALFADGQGMPLHAARQVPSARWTSKLLGEQEDIEHDLRDLEGPKYGAVVLMMKRPTHA